MDYFLAIDAGGTKTRCVLADETRVLARATTGTVKPVRVSEQEATARLHAMLSEVAASAGVSLGHITRTCIGLAGLSNPSVRAWASRALSDAVSGELILCGDEEIALDAAYAGGPGVLVVAGTGSNAIGRAADGTLFSAGGWGPVLGDEGSGHWIGLEALRAALRARDRDQSADSDRDPNRTPTGIGLDGGYPTLLREIERHWKLTSLGDLVAYGNQRADANRPAPDFASLAPVVARRAEQGDVLAVEVLQRAGEELAALVTLVCRKMSRGPTALEGQRPEPYRPQEAGPIECVTVESPACNSAPIPVAFTGGVLTHIVPVRAAMTERLAISLPAARVRHSAVDPLDGGLCRARSR